jgi:hypothetical protein
LWGYKLISDFDLGELEPTVGDNGRSSSILLKLVMEKGWTRPREGALEYRLENGDLWQESWNSGEGYISRFPGLCSFRILPETMHIECAPHPEAATSTVAHLILDHAIPRLLSLKPGFLVIHASAMQVEGQVIAVLGQSGQGKSTLAAWFASRGFPILTDDCLLLRWDDATHQWLAQPSYQSVRLWPDSVDALGIEASALREFAHYSLKKRTGKQADLHFARSGAPLKTCFVLTDQADSTAAECTFERSEGPQIRPLPINEAFISLAQAVFRLETEDEQINRREFEALTMLTDTVHFWSLAYERKYDWLPEVQSAIIKKLQASSYEPE